MGWAYVLPQAQAEEYQARATGLPRQNKLQDLLTETLPLLWKWMLAQVKVLYLVRLRTTPLVASKGGSKGWRDDQLQPGHALLGARKMCRRHDDDAACHRCHPRATVARGSRQFAGASDCPAYLSASG